MNDIYPTTRAVPRRALLRGAVAALAAIGLAGCGFELRKAPVFVFKTLSVPGNSAFLVYLRRNIASGGTVTLVPADKAATADAILDVLSESRERVVISTNSAGEVRDLELRLSIRFRLRTPAGKELLNTQIQQRRDLTYNETNALSKDAEAEMLFRDMQNDAAQQLQRRLAAIKEL
ncbi:hypothetical protein BH10PSE18_BH10PSE18_11160 [soil metagenome]